MSTETNQTDSSASPVSATPGRRIRETRERLGISRERLAEQLRLHPKLVVALEEDRYDDISAPLFVRGYLRNVAKVLELDEKTLLAGYDQFLSVESAPELSRVSRQPDTSGFDMRVVQFGGVAVAVVTLVLAVLWWQGRDRQPVLDGDVAAGMPADVADELARTDPLLSPRAPLARPQSAPVMQAEDMGDWPSDADPMLEDPQGAMQSEYDATANTFEAAQAGSAGTAAASEGASATEPGNDPSLTRTADTSNPQTGNSASDALLLGGSSAVPADAMRAEMDRANGVNASASASSTSGNGATLDGDVASSDSTADETSSGMDAAPLSNRVPTATDVTPRTLTIEPTRDAWLEVTDAGGDRLYFNTAQAGERINLEGEPPYSIVLGNATHVDVAFGGRAVDLGELSPQGVARLKVGSPEMNAGFE